jgi:hypothetical protein
LMRIRDPGWKNSDPRSGMEKSRIRDPYKHPRSATLIWIVLPSKLKQIFVLWHNPFKLFDYVFDRNYVSHTFYFYFQAWKTCLYSTVELSAYQKTPGIERIINNLYINWFSLKKCVNVLSVRSVGKDWISYLIVRSHVLLHILLFCAWTEYATKFCTYHIPYQQ